MGASHRSFRVSTWNQWCDSHSQNQLAARPSPRILARARGGPRTAEVKVPCRSAASRGVSPVQIPVTYPHTRRAQCGATLPLNAAIASGLVRSGACRYREGGICRARLAKRPAARRVTSVAWPAAAHHPTCAVARPRGCWVEGTRVLGLGTGAGKAGTMATWHGDQARDIPFAVPFVHRLRFTSNVLRQDAGVLLRASRAVQHGPTPRAIIRDRCSPVGACWRQADEDSQLRSRVGVGPLESINRKVR